MDTVAFDALHLVVERQPCAGGNERIDRAFTQSAGTQRRGRRVPGTLQTPEMLDQSGEPCRTDPRNEVEPEPVRCFRGSPFRYGQTLYETQVARVNASHARMRRLAELPSPHVFVPVWAGN